MHPAITHFSARIRTSRSAVALGIMVALCAPSAGAAPRALLISDVHLDPFVDLAQAREIRRLPSDRWAEIFARADTEAPDLRACGEKGPTTSPAVLRRTLDEISSAASDTAFTVLAGDLLVHQLQCRHAALFPDADASEYREFAAQMVIYLLHSIRAATQGRPVYLALGNHDSGCGNYRRDVHDPFLSRLAEEVAAVASDDPAEQAQIKRSFARDGAYRIAQAPIGFPLQLALIDTTPLSRNALACDGSPGDGGEGGLQWLEQRVRQAADAQAPLWVIGHIPPGVDVRSSLSTEPWAQQYASVLSAADSSERVVPFLADERLAAIIAGGAGAVKLALFGHTHMNEWRLVGDVPTKLLPSVSPSNGNLPAFTIGTIGNDGSLLDYQVHAAADLEASSAWTTLPSFRELYQVPAFNAAVVAGLLRNASANYRQHYMVGHPDAAFLRDDSAFRKYMCSLTLIEPIDYFRCAAAQAQPDL